MRLLDKELRTTRTLDHKGYGLAAGIDRLYTFDRSAGIMLRSFRLDDFGLLCQRDYSDDAWFLSELVVAGDRLFALGLD